MQAIVWTKAGSPEVLQLQEVAKPIPKGKEILIRIHAATITAADCELRRSNTPRLFKWLGLTKHLILGQEVAGEIEAIGKKVTRFKVGDPVFGWSGLRLGAYAEYTCLPENARLALKPPRLSYAEAATLPVGGLDAVYFLRKAHIQGGEKVLINGAGGSIGTFAVQMAHALGAEVTAVDKTEKLAMLRSLGATQVIDYTQADFTQTDQRYDVIFDVIGTTSYSQSRALLTQKGRYLLANPQLSQIIHGQWSPKKVITWKPRGSDEYAQDLLFLQELIEAEKIKAVIDQSYPLEQTADAHRYVETGNKKGHVVIRIK